MLTELCVVRVFLDDVERILEEERGVVCVDAREIDSSRRWTTSWIPFAATAERQRKNNRYSER